MTQLILEAYPLYETLVSLGATRRSEVDITATDVGGGLDVSITGAVELTKEIQEKLGSLAANWGSLRLSWNGEVVVQSGSAAMSFGKAKVEVPPGSFLQATSHGEAVLVSAMREAVAGATKIADLFAGCGTFSLPLAEESEVHAVEGVDEMLDALDQAWRHSAGLKSVTTEARDLFRRPLLPEELNRYDAIVIDPPRAGAEAQCQMLAESNVNRVGFVSCNPVTFARDAKILTEAGFRLSWLDVVDQFRWSTHVEVAGQFLRD